jgi:DNA-binding NarL/FixJ family response regulator
MNRKQFTPQEPARIMIVDDHPLVRFGLEKLLEDEPDLQIVEQVTNASEALVRIDEVQPDLLVVDISLHGTNGVELVKEVRTRDDRVRVLVASMYDEELYAERCLRAGALGYVCKQEPPARMIEAMRSVLEGKVFVSGPMAERMLQRLIESEQSPDVTPIHSLSDRELEVFTLMGRGLTTREIADQIGLSSKTIQTYRETIKKKLRIGTNPDLIRQAVMFVIEKGSENLSNLQR